MLAEGLVVTPLDPAQAWLVVIVVLSVAEGLLLLFVLTRLLRQSRPPARERVPADEAFRHELTAIGSRLAALEQAVERAGAALPHAIQGVGVVRYNPFPDMGGNMSFSLALLDGHANGVVLSVLTNREGSRVYGKAVENGNSSYPLSDEERQALTLARNNRR